MAEKKTTVVPEDLKALVPAGGLPVDEDGKKAAPADRFFVGFEEGSNRVENRSRQIRTYYFKVDAAGVHRAFGVGPSDDRDREDAPIPTERKLDDLGVALLKLHPVFATDLRAGNVRIIEG